MILKKIDFHRLRCVDAVPLGDERRDERQQRVVTQNVAQPTVPVIHNRLQLSLPDTGYRIVIRKPSTRRHEGSNPFRNRASVGVVVVVD